MKGLERTPRTYFDSCCHEYQRYPVEQKLLDIGYATWYGHDIMEDIRYILENYAYVSADDIQRAIWQLLAAVDHVDSYLSLDRGNSLETDVRMLIEDLMRVFRLPGGKREKAYLGESPRRIRFGELDAMNFWKSANEDGVHAYALYTFGHWTMFPGDGEIIRRFNLERGRQDCSYPSYVFPEPWYGCPTKAKVVVLGNEARYDDFISRVQNILLSQRPSIAEEVTCRLHSWLKFERKDFYDLYYLAPLDNIVAPMDLYNSPTYRHWLTEFRHLASALGLDTKGTFYSKIAVINANPYPSVGAAPLAAGLLPSHYFLRQLVRFIVNQNQDVKFVLPSETLLPLWREILGDVYTDLFAFGRIIVLSERNKSMRLTVRNLSSVQISVLRELLKD